MNKFILSFLFLGFIISCQQTTEQKLLKAVEKLEKKSIENDHQEIESFKIDSVVYSLGTIGEYFSSRLSKHLTYMNAMSESEKSLERIYRDLNNDSSLQKLYSEQHDRYNEMHFLDSLSNHADTTIKVYFVKYRLNCKTNKNSYNDNSEVYLYANDLSVVYVNTDSLYKLSKKK
jgi:hypothetical protein